MFSPALLLSDWGRSGELLLQHSLTHPGPLTLALVFSGGLLTSLGPCSLSLLPVTLAYLAGFGFYGQHAECVFRGDGYNDRPNGVVKVIVVKIFQHAHHVLCHAVLRHAVHNAVQRVAHRVGDRSHGHVGGVIEGRGEDIAVEEHVEVLVKRDALEELLR